MSTKLHATPFLFLLMVGCGITGPQDCVPGFEAGPAVQITVIDAATGEPIAEGATGTISEGDFSEELEPVPPGDAGPVTALGFYQLRNGEYGVTIHRDGYVSWVQTVVVAIGDECVRERPVVEVTAELVAAEQG